MALDFVCDPTCLTVQIDREREGSTCHYELNIRSAHACPVVKRMSASALFLLFTLVAASAYLGGGVMYGRHRGATGMEAVPHIDRWRALAVLVRVRSHACVCVSTCVYVWVRGARVCGARNTMVSDNA